MQTDQGRTTMQTDQLRLAQNRNPPDHRRIQIATTIPFIPAYRAKSALNNEAV
jgi:hypothetical protein